MRRVCPKGWLVLLSAGMVLLAGGSLRAADAPKAGGSKKVTLVIYDATGHEKEIKLDLGKEAELSKAITHLSQGEVAKLTAERETNLLELRYDLGLWTLVVFLLLLGILHKTAWGPMLEGLRKREENIQAAIVDARAAREEAGRLRDELQAERNKAAEKVREMFEEARKEVQQAREEMLAKAKADIQAERDRLLREIRTAHDQTLQELMRHLAQLATLISTKAIRRSLSLDDHRNLVNEAIAELTKAGTEVRHQLSGSQV